MTDKPLTQESWDALRERLIEGMEIYRDRFSSWKSTYYSALLTVCGILLAFSVFSEKEDSHIANLKLFSVVTSVACGFCIIRNILAHIKIYKEILTDLPPIELSKLNAYIEEKTEKQEIENPKRSKLMDIYDRLILIFISAITVAILMSNGFTYISNHL